jgi:carbonic anhydrase
MDKESFLEIHHVQSEEQLQQVRRLFEEYWNSFGFTPCFQNFGDELLGLPGEYARPGGRLALAFDGVEAAGCVALRRLDDTRCEAKRLYVRPEFRNRGIGRALLDWAIAEARAAGYQEMMGDTMPVMDRALGMYDRMGFERTAPYLRHPTEGAICIRLRL